MKVLFYGTPEFALPTLEAVLRHHEVVAVVTQPDRPAHRGQRVTLPPVKIRAEAAGLTVLQPPRLRDPGWPERLRALGADVGVVAAFGQILSRAVLDAPARGSINVHASLLPRYRGAAPIAWAIMRGESQTGITTFLMDEGLDTGAILRAVSTPIGAEETAGELAQRLAVLGAEVLLDTLACLDTLTPSPPRRERSWPTGAGWPSPPDRASCSRWRSSPRTGAPSRGPSSSAAPGWPRAPASPRRDLSRARGGRARARARGERGRLRRSR